MGEVILSGPADTGKTIACLQDLHTLCLTFPGLQAAMIRQTYKSIASSCFESFVKKVVPGGVVRVRGGDLRPEQIVYPNGSVIWIGGMDNPDKVLSSERDVVYINQAEELGLKSYEYITTRANGRAGNMPGFLILGDCNPGPPTHWILKREKAGKLTRLVSTHRDNPEIYDPLTGVITEGGKIRLQSLSGLTGSNLDRLYKGLWVSPEGAIYELFRTEPTVDGQPAHVVTPFPIPGHWPRIVGIDPQGAFTAAVWLAFDPGSGVLYLYREYMEPFGKSTPDHVQEIIKLSKGESIFYWAGGGPTENQARVDFLNAGIPLMKPEVTDVWAGIDRVNQLLKSNALYIFSNCEGILGEIGDYRRIIGADGSVTDKIHNKETYHLLDGLRYAVIPLTSTFETIGIEDLAENYRIGADY